MGCYKWLIAGNTAPCHFSGLIQCWQFTGAHLYSWINGEALWENRTQWPSQASHLNLGTCSSAVPYPWVPCISHPTVQCYDYFVSKRQMESTCTCMTDSTHISPYLMCWIIVTSPPINHHALSVMCRSFFWCQQGTTCWYCLKNNRNHLCMCVRFHAPVQVYMCMHWFQCLEHKAFCQKKDSLKGKRKRL